MQGVGFGVHHVQHAIPLARPEVVNHLLDGFGGLEVHHLQKVARLGFFRVVQVGGLGARD